MAYNRCGRAVIGICADLERVFQYIEPAQQHDEVYGPALQRLLFVTCSEIETSWAGILKANGYLPKRMWKTDDYVELSPAMGLSSYELGLVGYSNLPPFKPFAGWDKANPTGSLKWYDAYNKVKHDNDVNAHFASLESVLNACAGLCALLVAQFGEQTEEKFQGVFRLYKFHPFQTNEMYQPVAGRGDWTPVNYF